MSKLHYCLNGNTVTEQVQLYQKTGESCDYLPIQLYYDNYKDVWFSQLSDYMDRMTFEADFDYKLSVAVTTFKSKVAAELRRKNGYSELGAFNGYFYRILSNWKSNIKTSSFRVKRRPAIQCPVCGRWVGRIDVEHLEHYKTVGDLPKFVVWEGNIFEVTLSPKQFVVTWGEKTKDKMDALKKSDLKAYATHKRRARWPWKLSDGQKGVLCPFTHRVVPEINDEYIRSLHDRYSRYAEPMSWEEFQEQYPRSLIQSEIYGLQCTHGDDEKNILQDQISIDNRLPVISECLDYCDIKKGCVPFSHENVFFIIESFIQDETDQEILKLIAGGYSIDDVASTLEIDKKEVRTRIKSVRSPELHKILIENV